MRASISRIWKSIFGKTLSRPAPRARRKSQGRLEVESLENRLTPSATGIANPAPGMIVGHVYVDGNRDGVFDAGDIGLPGAVVTLTGMTAGSQSVNVKAITDANGTFFFRELQPGTYTLTRSAVGGFTSGRVAFGSLGGTPSGAVISNISVAQGQVGLNYNFGMFANALSGTSLVDFTGSGQTLALPPAGPGIRFADNSVQPTVASPAGTGSLSGVAYFDTNDNGHQDPGEVGIAGVLVTLSGIDDRGTDVLRGAFTTATGAYVFTGLRAGTYTLNTPAFPATIVPGLDTVGTLGGFIFQNNVIANITMATGQKGTGYNFGEQHALATPANSIVAQLADDTFGPVAATSTNLVNNPGFETGSFSPWTTGGTGANVVTNDVGFPAHSGNSAATFGSTGTSGSTISQTITTIPGHTYSLDFWVALTPGQSTAPSFSASWGSTSVFSLSSQAASFPYAHEFVANLTATSTTTVLKFTGTGSGTGQFTLDDVSVVDNSAIVKPASGGDKDNLTTDPTIKGTVLGTGAIKALTATIDSGTTPINILANMGPGNHFLLNSAELGVINNGALGDGQHTLHLIATDAAGHTLTTTVTFTLKTLTAPITGLTMGTDDHSGTFDPGKGLRTTTGPNNSITGFAAPGATVVLNLGGFVQTVVADATTGTFTFSTGANLASGPTNFTLTATDNAGNVSSISSFVVFDKNGPTDSATPLTDQTLTFNGGSDTLDLSANFTSANFTNSVVRFDTSSGPIYVTLDDTAAPQTVANFFNYVTSGRYNNDIISRLIRNFVLQGGGATFSTSGSSGTLTPVTTDPGVPNEFSASRSNVPGTIAMAQSGGDINSGTSQFFFNLVNNGPALDGKKFVVFGNLANGFAQRTINTLIIAPTKNESSFTGLPGTDLNNIPLNNYTGTHFPTDTTAANYELISDIAIVRRTEALSYKILTQPNSSVATATVNNDRLTINPVAAGTTTITIEVTDMAGLKFDKTINIKVNPTTSTITASPATATFGSSSQAVTLTATVKSGGSNATSGTVSFSVFNGATQIGSTVTGAVSNGAATAIFTLPGGTAAGTYSIHADYSDPNFGTSSDHTKNLTVNKASTTAAAAATSTSLSTTSQNVTLSATVTSTNGPVNEGTVAFTIFSGNTQIGTTTTSTTVSNGSASVTYSLPANTPVGTYTIQAVYLPGADYTGSSDRTHSLTVTGATTTTAGVSTSTTFSNGAQSVTLNASVTSAQGGTVNAGTVTFTIFQGATQVGTPVTSGTVSGGAASVSYTLPANTASGTYTIQAVYNGATNFAPSSDNTASLTVTAPTTPASTTTVASAAAASFGSSDQPVALTATVTSGGSGVKEGTVQFIVLDSSSTPVGSPVLGSVTNGTATANFTLPAGTLPGTYSIQATYQPGPDFTTSSDTTQSLTVSQAPTTTTAASASTAFSSADQFVTLNATVTSVGGPVSEGTVTFTLFDSTNTQVGTPVTTSSTITNGAASVSYQVPGGTLQGSYTIQAVYNAGSDYLTSTDSSHKLTIS
jgi:cyclophilin family peptidyl-prolyl cis-trans isomerase